MLLKTEARSSLSSTFPNKITSTLLITMMLFGPAIPVYGQQSAPPTQITSQSQIKTDLLEPGIPIDREMKGGESHSYQVKLLAGEYLDAIVEQRGIDVMVTVFAPDGKQVYQVDGPTQSAGPEPIYLIAESSGNYRIEVTPTEKLAPTGKYQLKITSQHIAEENDREKINGYQKFCEAEQLKADGKAEAIGNYEEAIKIFHKAGFQFAEVIALYSLSGIYDNKGDYQHQKMLLERVLEIQEQALGRDNPALANTINDLAVIYYLTGNYLEAEPRYQRAISIIEKAFGNDHIDLTSFLSNLALMYSEKSEIEKAEVLYQRVLLIRTKVYGDNHFLVARLLNNLAELFRQKGDYSKAEPMFHRALSIYQSSGIENSSTTAALSNLALLYQNKGDYQKAEQLLQQSLVINEKLLGKEHFRVASVLNNLAVLYRDKGDFNKAEPLFLRALSITEKNFGAVHPLIGLKSSNLAEMYRAKGDYEKAEPLFQKALSIAEKTFGVDNAAVADSLSNLARLYQDKGEYDKAEPLFQRAVAIYEKSLGSAHANVAIPLNHLAALYRAKGEIPSAISCQTRANETRERELLLNLISGSESTKLLYLNSTASEKDRTISLHLQSANNDPVAAQMAFNEVLRRKGRLLDAMADTVAKLRRNAKPEAQKLFSDLSNYRASFSTLSLKGPGKDGVEIYRTKLKELQEQCEKIEAEIGARSSEFRNQFTAITLENVQKTIPDDAVLAEFIIYSVVDAQTRQFGNAHYAVYLLNNRGELRWTDLGEVQKINSAIAEFRSTLIKQPGKPLSDIARAVKPTARAVDELIMRPVRKLIGDKHRLLISPDGALNLLPFDALVDEKQHYLIENYQISYLTSGRDLIRLQDHQQSQQPPLIIADPDYGNGDGPILAGRKYPPLKRLKETASEAAQIGSTLEHAQVQLGAEATESALKSIDRPTILHIATHGYFLNNSEINIAAASNKTRALGLPSTSVNLEELRLSNPLLRSFLFFSGANKERIDTNNNANNDDGVMTALETAGLNLTGTKLVVLSACDTGVGEVKNGDGVYGLRRALVLAGAETQMISLWEVDDAATKDLMINYYRLLQSGEGRSTALRKVQLNLLTGQSIQPTDQTETANQKSSAHNHLKKRAQYQHPYYWASFIESGEWGNLAGQR